ncbi:hypothetical protein [Streptosporangium carneum]|uniref:Uncharacterized protein n=1 Tax=Streptosporangium carneum TaxID=47481 RepID=A0A9W6HXD5_9ACTN|nr:hypothetical protein [Streptosporangium carneum]GLK07130.1 hypothetical protein GCM10017600_05350 [Streptosporangium carneum]
MTTFRRPARSFWRALARLVALSVLVGGTLGVVMWWLLASLGETLSRVMWSLPSLPFNP